ncbi:MAG: ribosome-binding factor A [Alphaproteobacteria bacterium CG_4_9_14_3_um_filter_47_13]|nr:MAG: ribosome-binding factor A [Alphaproteobacteria bacterium CG_4_9_14_3_um_filter_47_13]
MSGSSTGSSQRQLRVGEQLRHNISETLQRGHFDNLVLLDKARNVTVTEVRASPDLKNATAYIITLGGMDIDTILPALNESAFTFQKEIGRKLSLKFTPRLRFVLDHSFDEAQKIERILDSLPETKDSR